MAVKKPKIADKSNALAIYKDSKGNIEFRADVKKDTIWATQNQIARLFDTERSVVTKHINNVLAEEIDVKSNVQKMHIAKSDKLVSLYSLDVVLAVGYRTNSKKAIKFRIWATKTLKKYLVQGYAINENRLLEANEKFQELKAAINFLQNKSKHELLAGQEQEILDLLSAYSKTLTLLEQYDKNNLKVSASKKPTFKLEYPEAKSIVAKIKTELTELGEAGELFGIEPENKFESIIKNLYQTFDGKELYKTVEEKAAHLMYLTIKDHPFTDGNKRTGSFLFVYFLERNGYLYNENGEKKIGDNALVALALLVAVSDPNDKDVIVKIITNLLKN